ncbi:hypothetical protein ASPACDRAFT_64728 [Aspergillus aculeatus ATCC 16872]|uniref:Cell wall protein PhiA n=1 Tax=Aspergillus aculeatus (strain ATCC 16872 / CBS 172.66 / WB 5094) TaxID=690307 RepID=A0A1L9WG36_ASPA1|nr:uncharacterized protein ASPACDRAFT_64728 [Aspergillus aculeatus ATCC 16872]OJJ95130.1 hypothetical protein ASPACDRAFT_64728 [Aspergillus aculeatus ATCC 16872]
MKTVLALSAVISGAFAAAAVSSSASPFQLVISDAQSRATELKGRALISQSDAFILAPAGEHGINFTGGDGSLGIQNGDVVYVGSDGHVDLKSTNGIAAGGLTQGFTTGSDNALEWAQGQFFACPHVSLYAAGPPTYMIYATRSGVALPTDCIAVDLAKVAV